MLRTVDPTPSSDETKIQKLLHEIAYGNLGATIMMLDADPELLMQADSVEDPAGNKIIDVKPYELVLGAGADDVADKIAWYFSQISNGEEERLKQYKKYHYHFNVSRHPASNFDFNKLARLIYNSSDEEVMAALTFKLNPNSELHQMLVKLRKTFPPREINGGELHFNYTDLINAFRATQIFNKRNDHYKYTLFVNQALGYLQRGLPACDRQTVANGIIRTIHEKNVKRTFIYNPYSSARRYDQGCFPITANDHSTDGLGYKFAALTPDQLYSCASYPLTSVGEYFEKYVNNKKENLLKHRNPLPQDQPRPMAYQPQIKLELPLPEPPEPQHPSQGPLNNLSCAEALLNLFDIQMTWQEFESQRTQDERFKLIYAFIIRLDSERKGELFTSAPTLDFLKAVKDKAYTFSFGGPDHVHDNGCGCGLKLAILKEGKPLKATNIMGGLGNMMMERVWKLLNKELYGKAHPDCNLEVLGKHVLNQLHKNHLQEREGDNDCEAFIHPKKALGLLSLNKDKLAQLERLLKDSFYYAGYNPETFQLDMRGMSSTGGRCGTIYGVRYDREYTELYFSASYAEVNLKDIDFNRVMQMFAAQVKMLPAIELELPYNPKDATNHKSWHGMTEDAFDALIEKARRDPALTEKDLKLLPSLRRPK